MTGQVLFPGQRGARRPLASRHKGKGSTIVGYGNRLTADQMTALNPDDVVTVESGLEYARPRHTTARVLRVTGAHVDVCCETRHGGKYVERYRIRDGLREGAGRAQLVNPDPHEPADQAARRRTQRIDNAYRAWTRRRGDLDALRELQDAISEVLDEALVR